MIARILTAARRLLGLQGGPPRVEAEVDHDAAELARSTPWTYAEAKWALEQHRRLVSADVEVSRDEFVNALAACPSGIRPALARLSATRPEAKAWAELAHLTEDAVIVRKVAR